LQLGKEPRPSRKEEDAEAGKQGLWGGTGRDKTCPLLCKKKKKKAPTAIYFNAVNKQFKYYPSSIISNMVT
jgi:hypothetical protein